MEKHSARTPLDGQPYILGTFTDWQPRRMMSVGELCAILQNETKVLRDGDPEALRQYNEEVMARLGAILQGHKSYKDAQFFNYPPLLAFASGRARNPCKMFVYCDFIRPGRHSYLVTYERKFLEPDPHAEARLELAQ